MSMQELTDDQLDGLFRKSAEEFEPAFDPAAWQAMQGKLDAHDRQNPGQPPFWRKLRRWGPVGLLLLLIGISWYAWNDEQLVKPTTRQTTASASTPQITRAGAPKHVAARTNEPVEKDGRESADARRPSRLNKRVATPSQKTTNQQPTSSIGDDVAAIAYPTKPTNRQPPSIGLMGGAAAPSTANRTAKRPKRTASADYGLMAAKKSRSQSPEKQFANRAIHTQQHERTFIGEKIAKEATASISEAVPASTGFTDSEGFTWSDIANLTIRQTQWPSLVLRTQPTVTMPKPAEARFTQPVVQQRGLSVQAVVSPDLSTIGLRNFARPGTNVGMMVEYRFASRWSVQTGVMHSLKIYRYYVSGNDYTQSPNQRPVLESVDGRCNMLDVPINLRYDIALRPRPDGVPARWFVSGGLTSYIILREVYKYNFKNPADQRPPRSERTPGFTPSQLNVSLGYERPLTRRLAWQVEPFIKVPLRGMGYFKYNLISTGAFISLRYRL